MDIDPLSLIAMRCGGDKFGSHVYTPIYHTLLERLRYRPLKLLEIGIGGYGHPKVGGSSLMTWAEYFPNAQIVGLDISEKQLQVPSNVKVFQGSQDDPLILQRIADECGPFDVIIDDASHIIELTKQSFFLLYPSLNKDGIYVVEDTQTSFREQTGGHPDGRNTMFQVANSVSLAMHRAEGYKPSMVQRFSLSKTSEVDKISRFDAAWQEYGAITHSVSVYRNLIVFQRGDNTYPSNTALDFNHPAVQRNYQTMEIVAALSPSARDSLARIDMNIWSRRFEQAAALAIATAERYPDNVPLLHELRYMMEWAKRAPELAILQARINALAISAI